MAANSKHYGDVYLWLINMINNCDNIKHTGTISNLLYNARRLYFNTPLEDQIGSLHFQLDCKTDNLRHLHGS